MRGVVEIQDGSSWEDGPSHIAAYFVDGQEIERVNHGYDLEAAIDWARERAPVVVVWTRWRSDGSLTEQARRFSAGTAEPPGEVLPRLRPRVGEATMDWRVSWEDASGSVVRAATREQAARIAVEERARLTVPAGSGWTMAAPDVEPLESPT